MSEDNIPRLLSLMDRSVGSATYGCCDPNFWKYNLTDFPCARMQEMVLTLAQEYQRAGGKYFGNEKFYEWIKAGLLFWAGSQERNGSFSEWYPHENSYVATAMSAWAMSSTMMCIALTDDEKLLKTLDKAASFLSRRHEERAMNQEAAAAAALNNIAFILEDGVIENGKHRSAAEEKIRFILKSQHQEGWWPEYGGADMGYLSLTIHYLADYWYMRQNDVELLKAIRKAVGFLSYFLMPDYTVFSFGSRDTAYIIPSGFKVLASAAPAEMPEVKEILKFIQKAEETHAGPAVDDRYLAYNSYLMDYCPPKLVPPQAGGRIDLPYSRVFDENPKLFADYAIYSNQWAYCIVNMKRGGLLQMVGKDGANHYSGRMLAGDRKGDVYNTESAWQAEVDTGTGELIMSGVLSRIPSRTLTPRSNILLRLFQSTFGRIPFISNFVKGRLRNKMITDANESKLQYRRSIVLTKDDFNIDSLVPEKTKDIRIMETSGAYRYIPSSRFFRRSELYQNTAGVETEEKE
jgi:hypothetical protein